MLSDSNSQLQMFQEENDDSEEIVDSYSPIFTNDFLMKLAAAENRSV